VSDTVLGDETPEWSACFLAGLAAGLGPLAAMGDATTACEILADRSKARSAEERKARAELVASIYKQRVYRDATEPEKLFYVREVSCDRIYFTDGSRCDISDLGESLVPATDVDPATAPPLVSKAIAHYLDVYRETGSAEARAALEGAIAGELQHAGQSAVPDVAGAVFSVDVYRDTGVGLSFTTMNEAALVLARDGGTALVTLQTTGPGRW